MRDIDVKTPAVPRGHAFKHRDGDKEYIYFAHPYPMTRVLATFEALCDPTQYECFTCLFEDKALDRDRDGRLRYFWRKNAPPVQ